MKRRDYSCYLKYSDYLHVLCLTVFCVLKYFGVLGLFWGVGWGRGCCISISPYHQRIYLMDTTDTCSEYHGNPSCAVLLLMLFIWKWGQKNCWFQIL